MIDLCRKASFSMVRFWHMFCVSSEIMKKHSTLTGFNKTFVVVFAFLKFPIFLLGYLDSSYASLIILLDSAYRWHPEKCQLSKSNSGSLLPLNIPQI